MSLMRETIPKHIWFWPVKEKFSLFMGLFFLVGLVPVTITVLAAFILGFDNLGQSLVLPLLVSLPVSAVLLTVFLPKIVGYGGNDNQPSVFVRVVSKVLGFTVDDDAPNASGQPDGGSSSPGPKASRHKERDAAAFETTVKGRIRDVFKMRDKVLAMGSFLLVGHILFWLTVNLVFGATWQDTYILPWWGLIGLWFFIIAWMPRTGIFALFFTLVGMNWAFHIFGPTILMMLPHFLMLPFFYGFMMFFMFGSIMYPNLQQQKFYKPGDATWQVPEGSTVGQREAVNAVKTLVELFKATAEGRSNRKPSRGIVLEGPPGVGKTLLAKEIATSLNLPFASADGAAFAAPFAGFGQLLVLIFRHRVEKLAQEYGGCIIFVDEGETVFAARSAGLQSGSVGSFNTSGDVNQLWDLFPVDESGRIVSGCSMLDNELSREYIRSRQASILIPTEPTTSPIMMMGGMGGAGGSSLLPWLTWMDGAPSPPMMDRIRRNLANNLINAVAAVVIAAIPIIPVRRTVVLRGKIRRVPPAKAPRVNLLFMTATNRPEMMDAAIRRDGRMGKTARFVKPDINARVEVIEHYVHELIEKKEPELHPDLGTEKRIREFARATQGMVHATIEAVLRGAYDSRAEFIETLKRIPKNIEEISVRHIERLERIKEVLDRVAPNGGLTNEQVMALEELTEADKEYWLKYGDATAQEGWQERIRADKTDEHVLGQLLDADRQFWLRNYRKLEVPGWDDPLADWEALMDVRNTQEYGRADPGLTTLEGKYKTGVHEFLGHFIHYKAFLGDVLRPTLMSVTPRGKASGMVANQPVEERDPMPQAGYEGLLRVGVGSRIAEAFWYGEHQPGVIGDLGTATHIACFMVGKLAMNPYDCEKGDEDWEYYAKIGKTLIQVPDSPMLIPGAHMFLDKVLASPEMAERVAVFLGQAAVDAYHLIRANAHLTEPVVEELIELGEFSGGKLEEHWNALGDTLVLLTALTNEDRARKPDKIFTPRNPFRVPHGELTTEREEVLA